MHSNPKSKIKNQQSGSPVLDLPDADLPALRGELVHRGMSVAQADIYATNWQGQPAILKDFSTRPWLVRVIWSRRVAAREIDLLRRLDGLEWMPRLLATVGPEAFLMTRLPADRLPGRREPPPPPRFWSRARALIERMHARGIAHGDLRRKNLLIDKGYNPYLIDFATAIYRSAQVGPALGTAEAPPGRGWSEFAFRRCRRIDRVTFARIKASYGAQLSEDEQRWLDEAPLDLRIGRWLKRYVYRLRKGKTWRKIGYKRWRSVRRFFRALFGLPPPGTEVRKTRRRRTRRQSRPPVRK